MNEIRFTAVDVARIADLDPSTVEDWTARGVVPVKASDAYTEADALRFTAVRSLIGHGVPVYRGAEAIERVVHTQAECWKSALAQCASGVRHVFVYMTYYSSQAFAVFMYAGDNAAADSFLQSAMADGTTGQLVSDDGNVPPYPVPDNSPKFRVARYDIGPDLRRAFLEMKS